MKAKKPSLEIILTNLMKIHSKMKNCIEIISKDLGSTLKKIINHNLKMLELPKL